MTDGRRTLNDRSHVRSRSSPRARHPMVEASMKVTLPRSTTTSPSVASIARVRLADTRPAVDESCSPRIRTRIGSPPDSISTVPLPGATISSSQFLPAIKTTHRVAAVDKHQTLYRGQGHSFSQVFLARNQQAGTSWDAHLMPNNNLPPGGLSHQGRASQNQGLRGSRSGTAAARRAAGSPRLASPAPHPSSCFGRVRALPAALTIRLTVGRRGQVSPIRHGPSVRGHRPRRCPHDAHRHYLDVPTDELWRRDVDGRFGIEQRNADDSTRLRGWTSPSSV